MTVAQLLRDAVALDPSHIAIDGDGRTATFGELDGRADRVAHALIAGGVRRGERVAFIDRNSTEYWDVLFGALKAGVVLVPLNFRLSPSEVAWALDDCGARVVVAGRPFAHLVPAGPTVVVIDGRPGEGSIAYDDWICDTAEGDPGRDAEGGEYISLIYSSGTTGRPKGVLVSDEQQVWSVGAFGANFDVDAASRSVVPIPYYHVAGGGWALVTLTRGGTVIQSREPTAESMFDQLVGHRATHSAMVPAVMHVLNQSPAARSADFSALRQLVYGGAPISEPLLRASVATFGADFFQSYGLSETMGVTTLLGPDQHRLDGDLSRLRSAGRAIDGVELEIRDAVDGTRLGVGASGEIVVRAPSVTPGYWQRPDATADAFTADGFFRTGDMGTLDDEGFLYIRDRIKDMIVTGGENVYPAEVESVLAGHPAIVDVAVIGVPDERWGEHPLAVVVARGDALDPADVITYAREHMAHYKCPAEVVFVPELPRNPSGKVLKRELRAPYWIGHDRGIG
ncbi:MAG TPA: long-chain-fatty-acid--CoA ligase [Jatrophihabitans sp.]|uniref:long-chain-fatty-acid--CoA ligase n=1 Tax=Jatrophihabitans sp. TaxID=1932789 RepID=UPI002DFC539F|nr:long-chain-fatty-acid--CoA ligase [Jatrophihabitans sp.]